MVPITKEKINTISLFSCPTAVLLPVEDFPLNLILRRLIERD